MVSISLTISISRRNSSTSNTSLPHSSHDHDSVSPTHSLRCSFQSYHTSNPRSPPPYAYNNGYITSTLEEQHLLGPQKKRCRGGNSQYNEGLRTRQRKRMAGNYGSQPIQIEQKKSYGIGGAGNIRRPSDVVYAPRTNPDGSRRNSSIWSTSASPEGRRSSILSLFRRGSVQTEASNVEANNRIDFKHIDLGGKNEQGETH